MAVPLGDTEPYYNLGVYHRAVDTPSPQAQIWFDRGLVWAYAFNHEEAIRCFERALALDAAYNDIADAHGLAADCALSRDFGFDGKMLIHPSQIEAARAAFAPSAEEIEDARALLAEFDRPENRGRGVIAFRGRMVERLHAQMARRLLDGHA